MELATVTEGGTRLRVPEGREQASPGPGEAGAGFYNRSMALTRDLTVLAARGFDPPGRPEFLDGLAATGARGLRVANEADGWLVTLNDRSRQTARLAERNVEALGLADRAVVRNRDLNALLAEGRWAFVEVDPYGSPVPFLGGACRALQNGGLLALTATDTTALHGVKRKPARRRYLAEPPPRNAPGWKAAASRLLVGAIVREAARYDRAADPLVVHHHQHCVRAYVRVRDGARAADEALEQVRPWVLCPDCYTWGEEGCSCGEAEPTGPYWMGPLHDADAVEALAREQQAATLAEPDAAAELLDQLAAEAPLGPFYVDTGRAVKARGLGGPPAREALIEALADAGIGAARAHYAPTAIAVDGDAEAVLEAVEATAGGSR